MALLALVCTCGAASAKSPAVTVIRPGDASFPLRLAAREIRRYAYLRTGELATIAPALARGNPSDVIVIGAKGQARLRPYLKDKVLAQRVDALAPQQYVIKTLEGNRRPVVLIVGGGPIGALYGAYRFIEHLGVRFYLHGDVVPDEPVAWKTPALDETGKPLFALRGLNPWGSHPFGFDQWSADDYKSIIGQLAKMRMNFIGMHCYLTHPYTEPTVWVGTKGGFDGKGQVTQSYPSRYYNTLHTGNWGRINVKKTGDYAFGAAQMFAHDAWAPDVMAGLCPVPKTPEQARELHNRVGRQFNEAFTYARLVGVKTCLGAEAPLKKFMPKSVRQVLVAAGKNPDDPAVVREVYEGIFERIRKTHPLDYYWIWTPEGWTWRGNSANDMKDTVTDVNAAAAAMKNVGSPFKLATSGWVLGPKDDRSAFDRAIPKSIAMSAISRHLGNSPVDPAFGRIEGRPKWAIPWLEGDNGILASPQLWVGRTRKDAADALAYKCDGLMGLQWRTRVMGPNASALARAGWDQPWNSTTGVVVARKADEEKSAKPQAALGGKVANYAGREIAGTNEDLLYRTCRYDMRGYRLKVPDGTYRVTLKFCEPHFSSAGKRVCDVKFQGKRVLKDFDIFAEVGQFAACDRSFEDIKVTNGQLKIDIVNRKSMACISGIVVEGKAFSMRINCGGPAWKGYLADARGAAGGSWAGGNVPRGLPVADFYLDWATTSFGPAGASEVAALFGKIDGKLPNPLGGGCPSGSIKTDGRSWEQVSPAYAFVEELAAIRPKVKGAGNLERFDYWLNTFRYHRALARVQCALGRLAATMKVVAAEKDPAARKAKAVSTALPLFRTVVSEYGRAVRLRMATVTTHGGMATIVNLQQHSKFWPVAIDAPAKRLAAALGGPVPAADLPSKSYEGPSRIIVPTARTSLLAGEDLKLKAIVVAPTAPASVTFNYRPMGERGFKRTPCRHLARSVYTFTLKAGVIDGRDFEYFIDVRTEDNKALRYPVTAPLRCNSVIVLAA